MAVQNGVAGFLEIQSCLRDQAFVLIHLLNESVILLQQSPLLLNFVLNTFEYLINIKLLFISNRFLNLLFLLLSLILCSNGVLHVVKDRREFIV